MASYRKSKLNDNSAFLQFNWKADVVESWIGMFMLLRSCLWTLLRETDVINRKRARMLNDFNKHLE